MVRRRRQTEIGIQAAHAGGPMIGPRKSVSMARRAKSVSTRREPNSPEERLMATRTDFRGSFTALVTPFRDGAVDEKAYRGIVAWQIGEGTNGLVPVGTTGESPTLSHLEHRRAVEWCIDE